jgi:pyruvate,water dikinase
MALTGAYDNAELRALEGEWVELTVGAFEWTVRKVDQAAADAWWESHRPEPLDIGLPDLSVRDLTDVEDILDLDTLDLGDALAAAIPAFGGKGSHYGRLSLIGPEVPVPDAFSVPLSRYFDHMDDNHLFDLIDAAMADPTFQADPAERVVQLAVIQQALMDAPIDPVFYQEVLDKLALDYPGQRMRFRSSTNAEDLGNFTGAGLYTSASGDPSSEEDTIENAIKTVWASVWGPRAFEERLYYGIDHTRVGMALLVHRSFPQEEANGVAITANIFDTTGLEPAFYVNVQLGGESVVKPPAGVVTDQFLYYFDLPGQPIAYLAQSNLVPPGQTVLTSSQVYALGTALSAIHNTFLPVYGSSGGFYAMDTEFKFDGENGEEPSLYMKQARPYPGRNANAP